MLAASTDLRGSDNVRLPLKPREARYLVEIASGRIPAELARDADLFASDFEQAASNYQTLHPQEIPAGFLNGAEMNADAALRCRYVAGRTGPLFGVLVRGVVYGEPMVALAGTVDVTNKAAAHVGRARLVDAMRLNSLARLELGALKAWPFSFEAANDNYRRTANDEFRRWRRTPGV